MTIYRGRSYHVASSAYTPTYVDNNATAWGRYAQSSGWANDNSFTYVALIKRDSLSVQKTLFEIDARSTIQMLATNKLRVLIKDTANTTCWDSQSTSAVINATATAYHIFVQVDLGGTPSAIVKLNGVDVAMTDTTALTAGTGTIIFARFNGAGMLADAGGGSISDIKIADLWFDRNPTGSKPAFSSFYAGAPLDISAVGSPDVFLGHNASAATWNAGVGAGSATFT
jgi:hypothetical protein